MQLALEAGQVLGADSKAMSPRSDNQPRVSLPVWVFPVLMALLLAFLTNLSYSLYWAGQMTSNQGHLVEAIQELKSEVRTLRQENQELRNQVVGLAAVRQLHRRDQ